MHYFFYSEDGKTLDKEILIKNTNHLHKQIFKVLKFNPGEKIMLLNNSNYKFEYIIKTINKTEVHLSLIKKYYVIPNKIKTRLFIAIGKKDKLEFISQKASELGINEIIPIITQRTIKKKYREDRIQLISKEAIEQSHQNKLVKIKNSQKLNKIKLNKEELNIILEPSSLKNINSIKNKIKVYKIINIFIGPEGGFNAEELNYFKQKNNAEIVNISKNILRMETASIAGLAIIFNYLNR